MRILNNKLDKSFFSVSFRTNEKGEKSCTGLIFGKFFNSKGLNGPIIPPEKATKTTTFILSLWEFVFYNRNEEEEKIKTLPILRFILGSIKTDEILLESENCSLGDIEYKVETYLRYSYYSNIGKRLAVRGSKGKVYLISSEDDKELSPFSFARPRYSTLYKNSRPPIVTLVKDSREMKKLIEELSSPSA